MLTAERPKFFVPGEDLCVDEQLVAYRTRCNFRQYVNRPSLTPYQLTADIYLGRLEETQRETGQGARVVKQLESPFRHSGRNVVAGYVFHLSILQISYLHINRHNVGTFRCNRPYVPEAVKARRGLQELSSLLGFHDQPTLISFHPKPDKAVLVISTLHHNATTNAQMNKPEVLLHYNRNKAV